LVVPKPNGFKSAEVSKWPNLRFILRKNYLRAVPASTTTCPVGDYIQILELCYGYETAMVFGAEHAFDDVPVLEKRDEPDLFKIMSMSPSFLVVNFDGFLMLAMDKRLGTWHPEISAVVDYG
jgi:hypothetical protein